MNNLNNDLTNIFKSLGLNSNQVKALSNDVSKEAIKDYKNNGHPKPNYDTLMMLYDRKLIIIDGEEFYLPIIEKE
jgi:hypothetical protein